MSARLCIAGRLRPRGDRWLSDIGPHHPRTTWLVSFTANVLGLRNRKLGNTASEFVNKLYSGELNRNKRLKERTHTRKTWRRSAYSPTNRKATWLIFKLAAPAEYAQGCKHSAGLVGIRSISRTDDQRLLASVEERRRPSGDKAQHHREVIDGTRQALNTPESRHRWGRCWRCPGPISAAGSSGL